MRLRNVWILTLSLIAIITISNTVMAQRSSLIITLKNIPREEVPPNPKGTWWQTPLNVLTFTDARVGEPLTRIGENIERNPNVVIHTRTDVPAFASKAFMEYFSKYNGVIDPRAEYTLSGEVEQFFVTEKNLYSAEVKIRFTLTNAQGLKLWSGLMVGTVNLFGISLREVNYNEAFSDALQDAFVKLFAEDGFIQVWSGKINVKSIARRSVDINSLKAELIQLIKGGFDETTLLAYVKQRDISATLLADEMIEWSNAGIPKSVITQVITITSEKK